MKSKVTKLLILGLISSSFLSCVPKINPISEIDPLISESSSSESSASSSEAVSTVSENSIISTSSIIESSIEVSSEKESTIVQTSKKESSVSTTPQSSENRAWLIHPLYSLFTNYGNQEISEDGLSYSFISLSYGTNGSKAFQFSINTQTLDIYLASLYKYTYDGQEVTIVGSVMFRWGDFKAGTFVGTQKVVRTSDNATGNFTIVFDNSTIVFRYTKAVVLAPDYNFTVYENTFADDIGYESSSGCFLRIQEATEYVRDQVFGMYQQNLSLF